MTFLFTPLRNVLPMCPGAMRNAHQAVTPRVRYTSSGLVPLLSNSIGWHLSFLFLFFFNSVTLCSEASPFKQYVFACVIYLSLWRLWCNQDTPFLVVAAQTASCGWSQRFCQKALPSAGSAGILSHAGKFGLNQASVTQVSRETFIFQGERTLS